MPRLPSPLRSALHAALPPSPCEVCRAWGNERLCADWRHRRVRLVARCGLCGLALAAPAPAPAPAPDCGTCLRALPAFMRAVCAVDYAFPWNRLILDLKFHGLVDLATPLAQQLVAALSAEDRARGVDVVLPVPRAPVRLAERGYNQAWGLARRVAKGLAIGAQAGWLQRPVDGAHQADLPRKPRATNRRGAFMVHPRHWPQLAGRHVALVDDVMTTGATAHEATTALLRAGAASVAFWAVARTP